MNLINPNKPPKPLFSNLNRQLLGFSYLSFGMGFGPFIPLVAAWVFRRNQPLHKLLLQSFFFQLFFSAISISIFGSLFYLAYLKSNVGDLNMLGLGISIVNDAFEWFAKIICFVVACLVFANPRLKLPVFSFFASQSSCFLQKKSLIKALVFNFIWPGFGQLHLGQAWLGWVLVLAQMFFVSVLAFLTLYKFNFALGKDILSMLGFYVRIGDALFESQVLHPISFVVLGVFVLLAYLLAFVNLPLAKLFGGRLLVLGLSKPNLLATFGAKHSVVNLKRSFSLGLLASISAHLGVFLVVLLLPFIVNQKSFKEKIQQEAKTLEQKLVQEKQLLQVKPKTPQAEPKFKERTIEFNLELPDEVNGLNQFSTKPKTNKFVEPNSSRPKIGYGRPQKPLLEKKVYLQKHSKETKSYSEYLTSKVREQGRDGLIWQNAPKPYSVVLRYTVSQSGVITDIEIIEESGNVKMDALVISVVQSMSPLIKPKNNKKLVITELFWNTRGGDELTSTLQKSLATYPDGRIIESYN